MVLKVWVGFWVNNGDRCLTRVFVLISGIITSGGARLVGERYTGSGTRLDVTSPVQSSAPATVGPKSSTESVHRALKSVSRQSLFGKGDQSVNWLH